jgi:hypothetical protein
MSWVECVRSTGKVDLDVAGQTLQDEVVTTVNCWYCKATGKNLSFHITGHSIVALVMIKCIGQRVSSLWNKVAMDTRVSRYGRILSTWGNSSRSRQLPKSMIG